MKKAARIILASGLLWMTGCCSTSNTHWEYKTVHTIAGVNERTSKDWVLDQVIVNADGTHDYLLKRPIK
jgi:hypothetical protein